MEYFVEKGNVVRDIWGKSDTILFIFAGASAEFALNKAVDWLYFTGKLPADPLGRLFSTVSYARQIVFSEKEVAEKAIQKITAIHSTVEANRGAKIPDWAYRDVLFMLIHYSIAAYELLEKKLSVDEKEDVFDVFYRFGNIMNLPGLPQSYSEWLIMRKEHLQHNLAKSDYTIDLYKQYKKHLGSVRYKLLLESQILVVPEIVRGFLNLGNRSLLSPLLLSPLLFMYKFTRKLHLDELVKSIILPTEYKKQIDDLDVTPSFKR